MICPCQRQHPEPKDYQQCCERFHLGDHPDTPEQLMRSRYSGFVLGLSDYIAQSWHASTRPSDLALTPDSSWLKLDIIKANDKQVHFRAYFKDENEFAVLDELSDFILEENRWLYVKGKTQTHCVELKRNDVCLCGSGIKFKKCCA